MNKKIVVAGCRNYSDYEEAKEFIGHCIKNIKTKYNLIFVCGCCKGADEMGEKYAKENHFTIEYFPAEWNKYGKKAGEQCL